MKLGLFVSLGIVIVASILVALHFNEKTRCAEYGRAADKQTDYVLMRGCIVETRPDVWISRSVLD